MRMFPFIKDGIIIHNNITIRVCITANLDIEIIIIKIIYIDEL